MAVFLFCVFICFFVAIFIARSNYKKKTISINEQLNSIADFTAGQSVLSIDLKNGIALDETRKKIDLFKVEKDGRLVHRLISYGDILSVDVFEDGSSITQVVSGWSGKLETTGKVARIDLRLVLNDTKSPLFDLNFMNLSVSKNSDYYQQNNQKCRHWYGLIEVLINNADHEGMQTEGVPSASAILSISVADEIKKLSDLQLAGLITKEEYDLQKAKILSS